MMAKVLENNYLLEKYAYFFSPNFGIEIRQF